VRRSVADVLQQLEAEGLATSAAADPARSALREELQDDIPWYLRVAIGLGAWVATAFFFGFFVAVFHVDGGVSALLSGALLSTMAVWLRRKKDLPEFMRHSVVAVSLAGQGLMIASFHELSESTRVTGVATAALCVVSVWLMPDRVHRYLSTVAFVVALYVAFADRHTLRGFEAVTLAVVALTAGVWRSRLRDRGDELTEMLAPVGYALVVCLFGALLFGSSTHFGRISMDFGRSAVFLGRPTAVAIMLALALLVWKVADEHGKSPASLPVFAALAGTLALGLSTLSSPGIIAGAAVLTLAFDRRDKVLLGLGVVFLLVFGSVYYYSLHLTLMQKAGILAGTGVLMLAVRQRVVRA
jgi:hypothetical protein